MQFHFPWFLLLIESIHPFVMKVVCKSGMYSLLLSVFLLLPVKDLVAHKGVDAAFSAVFILLLSGRPSISETTSIYLVRVDDDFSKWMVVEAFLHYRPHLNDHSSVIKEYSDSSGIRTHVSEVTTNWMKPHRPLGHPAYFICRRASVYLRDLDLASKTSQKFVGCELVFQGQPELEKKMNSPVLSRNLHSNQVRIHVMLLVSFLLFENVSCLPQNGRCLLVFLLLLVSIRPSKEKMIAN